MSINLHLFAVAIPTTMATTKKPGMNCQSKNHQRIGLVPFSIAMPTFISYFETWPLILFFPVWLYCTEVRLFCYYYYCLRSHLTSYACCIHMHQYQSHEAPNSFCYSIWICLAMKRNFNSQNCACCFHHRYIIPSNGESHTHTHTG